MNEYMKKFDGIFSKIKELSLCNVAEAKDKMGIDPNGTKKIKSELGLPLPKSYEYFLEKYGWLRVQGNQFYGAPHNPKQTLFQREYPGFSKYLILISPFSPLPSSI